MSERGDLEILVVRARDEGDAEARLAAFGLLVRRFQGMAFGCAHAILGDRHLAEDAAQEAFLAAYRALPDLAEPRAFPAWLRRLVVSAVGRLTRKKRVRTAPLQDAAHSASRGPDPAADLERSEMRERVLAEIRSLPEHQRMATTLYYIDGYSQAEIAEFLSVPVGTVKKRIADSRKKLKERMVEMVDETLKSVAPGEEFERLVVRRAASEEDLARAAALLEHCARHHPEMFADPERAAAGGVYVVGPEGEVSGAGIFQPFDFAIGGHAVPTARPWEIGGEGSGVPDPDFVRSVRASFSLARERGIHLMVVHGTMFDHGFLGFVPSFWYPVVRLPVAAARAAGTGAVLRPADETEREDARRAYLADPWAPKISAYVGLFGHGDVHVIEEDGAVAGYATVDEEFDPARHCAMPLGHVTGITVRTRGAAVAAIREAARLVAKRGGDELLLMQSHRTLVTRTALALGGTYLLRPSCDLPGLDAEMAAILDLAGLTRDIEPAFRERLGAWGGGGASLSIGMEGETAGFAVEDGELRIDGEEREVHVDLPRWAATRLYLGYHGAADLVATGLVRSDLPAPARALLDALFPLLWPSAMPDPDVWPWVIGEPHPRYNGHAEKLGEEKAKIDALDFPWLSA